MEEKLNKQQELAAGTTSGPVLVVAGAGTGKTLVIVERINRLLKDGVSPKRILALTFTEKAAAEMLDRVNEANNTYELELPIMTFNAYGESILRRYAADIGLGRSFRLLGENAQIVFLRERLDELGLDYFAPLSSPDSQLENLTSYFSSLKQNIITPSDYHKFVGSMPTKDAAEKLDKTKHSELAHVYQTYIDLCRKASLIDYDDQIYLLIELLTKRPNVLREVQNSYDYVMVDEFQDTNAMQSVLVDMITGPKKNLFVVGDDDQSIYGWRGATLSNILDFKKRYPASKEITLIDNYRSTQEILDSAYRLIQHNNPYRLETQLKIDKRLKSGLKGTKPIPRLFKTLDQELQWVAEDIKKRVKAGTPLADIAILSRRNVLLKNISAQLQFADIEHVVIGKRYELYKEPIVRSILEAIKTVVDPVNDTSLYHTLTGPLFSLPAHALGQLAGISRRQHESLDQAIQTADDDEFKDYKQAVSQIKIWREKASSLSVGQLAYEIIDSSGYKDRLLNTAATDPLVAVAGSRLTELFNTMREFEQIALQPSALQYIEALPALQATGSSNEDDNLDLSGDKVNVLTIHRAKGLEWPVVYIVDLTEGSFPLRENTRGIALPDKLRVNKSSEADEHIYEERRLMYVAMTRAKNELILTHSEQHTTASSRKPSRFLNEIFEPADFITTKPKTSFNFASVVSNDIPAADSVVLPRNILSNGQVTLNASQVKNYLDCPLNFYYEYVLKVPQEPKAAQDYGITMHGLMEEINSSLVAGKLAPLKQLEEQLLSSWPKTGYISAVQRDRALEQAKTTLNNMYSRASNQPRIPLAYEDSFKFSLPEYKLTVSGRFDAVFPYGDSVEIVDYKTSTSVDTPEKAKGRASGSEQLTIYALAWQLLHDELPALVTLDFLDTGMQGSLKKTQRGLDGMILRLQKVADGIRAHDFGPGKDHRYCIHPEI